MDTKFAVNDILDKTDDISLVNDLFEMAKEFEYTILKEELKDELNS